MNPHNANRYPGTRLVAEKLGVSQPSTLRVTYRPGEPQYDAATQVIKAAYELDELHGRVQRAAQATRDALTPVAQGKFDASRSPISLFSLRAELRHVDHLVSKQNETYERLYESISAYRRLVPAANVIRHSNTAAHELHQEQNSGRDDDWAVAGDRRLRALEAVEAGGVRFRLTGIGDDPYVVWEKAQRQDPAIWPRTVQRLVADGLLHHDTSESLYRPGQLLSLTPQGEASLLAARAATPRVSAALDRSRTSTPHGPLADSAVRPVTASVGKPSRSR
ncbi:large ATP-binding protein [Streptomyces sp. NBC_01591]|uniref:large ATP-binding protein n=1 Tax=Streptomyces sp. NBC_01591 TaxID=2975888 RepID=UPI002DDB873D|nr:large ATP-binding protein [Streptomyces sp. NBC_01591]WSD68176.1 large ATP-binding protein [Streptomyces sp. NBC_01591]